MQQAKHINMIVEGRRQWWRKLQVEAKTVRGKDAEAYKGKEGERRKEPVREESEHWEKNGGWIIREMQGGK